MPPWSWESFWGVRYRIQLLRMSCKILNMLGYTESSMWPFTELYYFNKHGYHGARPRSIGWWFWTYRCAGLALLKNHVFFPIYFRPQLILLLYPPYAHGQRMSCPSRWKCSASDRSSLLLQHGAWQAAAAAAAAAGQQAAGLEQLWDLPRCGAFQKWGYPNSWMVFVRENPIKIGDLGVSPILGNPHVHLRHSASLITSKDWTRGRCSLFGTQTNRVRKGDTLRFDGLSYFFLSSLPFV